MHLKAKTRITLSESSQKETSNWKTDTSNTCFDVKRRDGLREAYWDPSRRIHVSGRLQRRSRP